jgi:hypothetical protein
MVELRLALTLQAMEAIAHGAELVLDVADDDVRVFIRCDDATVSAFQTQVQRALLHMLPVGDLPH